MKQGESELGTRGRPRIASLALAALVAAVLVGIGWGVRAKPWQAAQVDSEWAARTAHVAAPLVAALEGYRRAKGAYPDSLQGVVPGYLSSLPAPVAHPSGSGGDAWYYRRDSDHGYVLAVTALHWVSSFDVLLRHGDAGDEDWAGRGVRAFPCAEGWVYLVGGSALFKHVGLGEAHPGG
ncbi:MAG: hypothetical protein AB7N76_12880 [Planctomycetota bacterium]